MSSQVRERYFLATYFLAVLHNDLKQELQNVDPPLYKGGYFALSHKTTPNTSVQPPRARTVMAGFAPILALTVRPTEGLVHGMYSVPMRGIRVGESQLGTPAETKSAKMSSRALIHFLLVFPFQLLLQTTIVHTAIIPPTLGIAPTASGENTVNCVDNEGWIGNGIIKSDCAEAISEFYRTNVRPRRGQEYEFYTIGAPRISHFPWVLTPRKHDYRKRPVSIPNAPVVLTQPIIKGTCVVVIAMLDRFTGILPGASRRAYTRSDTATFNDIYNVAVSLSSNCVNRKREPEAGWSSTGKSA